MAVARLHYDSMKYVSVNDTKNHISRLLRRVPAGEEIVIARRGVPIAKLVALPPSEQRQVGLDAGRFTVPADFNQTIKEDGKDHTNL
jgi:prevent-host-death family protein